MKKVIIVLFALCLIGCVRKQITIEQYNEAKKYCEASGMKAKKLVFVTRYGGESSEVYGVECQDIEGNTYPVKANK